MFQALFTVVVANHFLGSAFSSSSYHDTNSLMTSPQPTPGATPNSTPVASPWNIGALLKWTTDFFTRKGIEDPRLNAELLLAHALQTTRMKLYTQYDRVPEEPQLATFRDLVRQRGERVPVAYLIGKVSFFSLDLSVTRDVLIPRPDTETLVEQIITKVRAAAWETPRILDLCTGSGCIAVTLAKNLKTALITATDISDKALAVAKQNAAELKIDDRISFQLGDLLAAVGEPSAPFHVICANPPYIATAQLSSLQPEVRDHEPRLALDGGPDGLSPHRAILAAADVHLAPGGLLALEIAFDQSSAAKALFESAGYLEKISVARDAANHPRCVMGIKKT